MRESTNFPGDYTLCVCFESRVEHYRIILQVCYVCNGLGLLDLESFKIIVQEEKITIDEEEYFENLNQLVEVGEL